MNKLIKGIRLHRKLRKRQEYLSYQITQYSRAIYGREGAHIQSIYLFEARIVNKAVYKLNRILPWYYYLISDIFGLSKLLRYVPPIVKLSDYELIHWDLVSDPGFEIRIK